MFGLLSVISRSMTIITETDAVVELTLSLLCFDCLLQSETIKDTVGNKATGQGKTGAI